MTSAVYASAEALAHRMIGAKGRYVTFTRGGAQIDPITQQITAAPSTYDARALALPMSAGKARYLFGDGADVTKARLDVHISLRGVSSEPRIGDRFTWGGRRYALISTEPLDPDGSGPFYIRAIAEAA